MLLVLIIFFLLTVLVATEPADRAGEAGG